MPSGGVRWSYATPVGRVSAPCGCRRVRHDDVADDVEVVSGSELFEEVEESVAGVWGAEDWAVTEAGEGEEVEVSGGVATDEAGGHVWSLGL